MAKYSREQRDRAVDLYIKYERCAADVIRELGYPSKVALLSWHAERLEEERTGVPSRRGERYRRYGDGQKRAAVDHYLEYGRRLSRTMRMLGYPKSKELLMAWIDGLAADYYGHVRDLWAQYGGIDMPEYDPPAITADRAVWQMEGGFNNTDFMGLHYKDVIPDENGVVHNNAGRTIDDLWPTFADEEQALEYVQNLIQTVGRLTMQRAVANDPTKPRWARVPRGAKTCAFCLMLASRGFAYLSEDTAGRQMQYHADCDIVPSWGSAKLKDYDPDSLYAMWKDSVAAAGDGDWHEALRQLRRLHADKLNDGVVPLPGIRWSHAPIAPTDDELARLSDYSIRKPSDRYGKQEKIRALRGWTGNDYRVINDYLFGNNSLDSGTLEQIEIIDEAINDHDTGKQFTVDRLMPLAFFGIDSASKLPSIPLGMVFDHAGYMACSLDAGGKSAGADDRVVTRILIPWEAMACIWSRLRNIPGNTKS